MAKCRKLMRYQLLIANLCQNINGMRQVLDGMYIMVQSSRRPILLYNLGNMDENDMQNTHINTMDHKWILITTLLWSKAFKICSAHMPGSMEIEFDQWVWWPNLLTSSDLTYLAMWWSITWPYSIVLSYSQSSIY